MSKKPIPRKGGRERSVRKKSVMRPAHLCHARHPRLRDRRIVIEQNNVKETRKLGKEEKNATRNDKQLGAMRCDLLEGTGICTELSGPEQAEVQKMLVATTCKKSKAQIVSRA